MSYDSGYMYLFFKIDDQKYFKCDENINSKNIKVWVKIHF